MLKALLVLLSIFSSSWGLQAGPATRKGCRDKLPPPCVCSDYVVSCINSGFSDTDMILQVSSFDWPQLDTFELTGNNFSELPHIANGKLFGEGVKHKHLQSLDLSSNNITTILADMFTGMPNLERLILANNRIRLMNNSRNLFSQLPRLQELNLTNALYMDSPSQISLWNSIFNKSDLSQLKRLYMGSNNIDYLPENFLCPFPELEVADFSGNRLRSFSANKSCVRGIVKLDLSDNDIDFADSSLTRLIDEADQPLQVNLSGNPFDCNCKLRDFIRWFHGSRRVVSKEKTGCLDAYPDSFEGVTLLDIKLEELKCYDDDQRHTQGVYIVIGLIIVGLLAFLIGLAWMNRRCLCKPIKQLSPSSFGGYAQLNRESEQAEAEFV